MKICFLADARAEHIRRWSKYFALNGHQVDLITFNSNTLDGYDPVRLHIVQKPMNSSSLPARICNLPMILGMVKRIIKDIDPDVIHAHMAGSYAWITALSGFHPYVITPWGMDILVEAQNSRWIRCASTLALRHADLITYDGINIKNEMIRFGIDENKMKPIIFGVDLRRFPIRTDEELKRPSGKSEKIIISTRTLTDIHDIETLVRAIPLVKMVISDVTFIIAGDGPNRPKLEALCRTLGVDDCIVFAGNVEEEEIARLLRLADVYVSTSLSDSGLASSTAEAMACQLPVIVTDNGDNKEWIAEGRGGFIVPVGSPELIADRIIRLLKDKDMCIQFGRENREIIEQKYNYFNEMEKMQLLYKEIICEH